MDADFSEKLMAVLSDPEAISKISKIASSLNPPMQNSGEVASGEAVEALSPNRFEEKSASDAFSGGDPRLALLNSVKPLLREEKRDRVDALIRAMAVASMMKNFRK